MRSMARAAPHAPHAAHIVHAAHAAASGGGCNGGDGGGCSGGGGGGGGGCSCCCCCSCGCCRSSAFSYSFCRSRLYPLPLKHVAASKAACFNFSLADGCFNDWSPLSPICPCAIQLTSGERPVYDSTFSSSLSSRSARKTQVRSRKKHRNGKKHVWQQEKNALQREKAISAAGKTPAKNAASQREKFKAAEKTPCSSTKAPLQQKKCILEAAGKNRPRREKTRPRQEKNRPRQEKNQQQRKSSFATQKVAATEKIHFRNGKKQQPCAKKLPTRSFRMHS